MSSALDRGASMKSLQGVILAAWLAAVSGCTEQAPAAPSAAPVASADAVAAPKPAKPGKGGGKQQKFEYDAVCVNPDVAVPDGFRGDVHPLLTGETRLELVARWEPKLLESKRTGIKLGVIDGASAPEYSIPDDLVALLTESEPAHERVTYGARAFSAFLPEEFDAPGQMWQIDLDKAAAILRQFHPATSMTFDLYRQPYGRRPGPAGAFGILRAVSADYFDVLFRVHGEFVLSEGEVLYTPACFLGRMLVDRRSGTVDSFQMRVPTDRPVNVNLTVTFKLPEPPRNKVTNIVFEQVDPMDLAGGDLARADAVEWDDELDVVEAHDRLKSAFYKFMDIDWAPAEDMLDLAQKYDKPIMLVVLTSPLDDQSC